MESRIPKVTVLMPVYNCELYIQEAVESILNQTYTDFEFLIIDDASTDKTVSIIKTYNDSRIQLIEKPVNTGHTSSLNYGLTIAKGKYIARMDGDDISLPERFEKQLAYMESNEDTVVCGTALSLIGEDNCRKVVVGHEDIKIKLLEGNSIAHPSVFLRKETLVNNSVFYDTLMEPAEDYDLWVRLSTFGKLHNLEDCLLKYRIHDSQVSNVRKRSQENVAIEIRFKLLTLVNDKVTPLEKEVYLKAINPAEKLDFDEFILFLAFKSKMLKANKNGFFDKKGFVMYWSGLEEKCIRYTFKNRTSYSFTQIIQYLSLYRKLNHRLDSMSFIKLTVKSILNYKQKSIN